MWFIAGAVIAAIVNALIASSKGRSPGGWVVLAIPLGLISTVVLAVLPALDPAEAEVQSGALRKCPSCAEFVKREAIKCRFCGEALPELQPILPEPPQPTEPGGVLTGTLLFLIPLAFMGVLIWLFVPIGHK